jgi:hypothetical protein
VDIKAYLAVRQLEPSAQSPSRGVILQCFSAAGLAVMAAAALPFEDLNGAVAEYKINLFIQGHRSRHIGEKGLKAWHFTTLWYLIVRVIITAAAINTIEGIS